MPFWESSFPALHWLKGADHCLAGALQASPDVATFIQTSGGVVSFSILIANLYLGARTYNLRDLLDNSSISSESNFFCPYVLQNPSLELSGNMTPGRHIIYHFFLVFPRFFPSSASTYVIFPRSSEKVQKLECISTCPNGPSVWKMTLVSQTSKGNHLLLK